MSAIASQATAPPGRGIDRTDTEPSRWRSFWTGHGLSTEQIHYRRTVGADAAAWQDPPDNAVVTGMAVNASTT